MAQGQQQLSITTTAWAEAWVVDEWAAHASEEVGWEEDAWAVVVWVVAHR